MNRESPCRSKPCFILILHEEVGGKLGPGVNPGGIFVNWIDTQVRNVVATSRKAVTSHHQMLWTSGVDGNRSFCSKILYASPHLREYLVTYFQPVFYPAKGICPFVCPLKPGYPKTLVKTGRQEIFGALLLLIVFTLIMIFSFTRTKARSAMRRRSTRAMFLASSSPECGWPSNSRPTSASIALRPGSFVDADCDLA